MSWGEVKHAINGSVGTIGFDSIDEKIAKAAYLNLYNQASALDAFVSNIKVLSFIGEESTLVGYDAFVGGGDAHAQIYTNPLSKKINSFFDSTYYMGANSKVYISPNIETIGDDALSHQNITSFYFFLGLKEIGNRAFRNSGCNTFALPRTVKTIGTNAFPSSAKVYVEWKEGEVAGAPWGASEIIYNYKHYM